MALNIGTWNPDDKIDTAEGAAALVAWVQDDLCMTIAYQVCGSIE